MGYIVSEITKFYGEKRVLENFSYDFQPGGFYALVGESGAGKTTLLRILLGLTTPDSGTLPQGLRYSAVFQENRLLPNRTAVENLFPILPKAERGEPARRFLAQILPEDRLSLPVEALSGGMQRRVAIARAMAAQSDFVILDEPFTGLDAETADSVAAFLLRNQRGRTLLIATHQLEIIEKYQPVVISM